MKPGKRPPAAQLEEELVDAIRQSVACSRPSMRSAANVYGHLYREVITDMIAMGIERPDLYGAICEIVTENLEEAFRSIMEQVHITADSIAPLEVVNLDPEELEGRVIN